MIAPRVHLNGTAKIELVIQLRDALEALQLAQHALAAAAPNARDYYVISPEAFTQAQAEHQGRMEKLQTVQHEVAAVWAAVEDGKIETE